MKRYPFLITLLFILPINDSNGQEISSEEVAQLNVLSRQISDLDQPLLDSYQMEVDSFIVDVKIYEFSITTEHRSPNIDSLIVIRYTMVKDSLFQIWGEQVYRLTKQGPVGLVQGAYLKNNREFYGGEPGYMLPFTLIECCDLDETHLWVLALPGFSDVMKNETFLAHAKRVYELIIAQKEQRE